MGVGSRWKAALDLLAAWVGMCSLGALPPVDFRAVCLERAVAALGCSAGGGASGTYAVGSLSSSGGVPGCEPWTKRLITFP